MLGCAGALVLWAGVLVASLVRLSLLRLPWAGTLLHAAYVAASEAPLAAAAVLGFVLTFGVAMADAALQPFNTPARFLAAVLALVAWTVSVVLIAAVAVGAGAAPGRWEGFTLWLPI